MHLINLDGLFILIGVVVACIMLGKSSPIFKVIMITGGMIIVMAITLIEIVR